MTQPRFIPLFWAMAAMVGLYQLPLIENTLNKHNIVFNINDRFTYAKDFQQQIEDDKIAISAYYENLTTPTEQMAISHVSKKMENTDGLKIVQDSHFDGTNLENAHPAQVMAATISSSERSYCKENCKILMIGDSVMGDVEFSMNRILKKFQPTWRVISGYKVSSGLTNQKYYDWPKTANNLVSQYKPDYVIVLMGTNDAQGMMNDGKAYALGQEQWRDEYKRRVGLIVDNLKENTPYWLWIQLPQVKNPSFNQRLEIVRASQAEMLGDKMLETTSILGANSSEVNMKLRASDGTHLNASGANLVAQHAYERLIKDTE